MHLSTNNKFNNRYELYISRHDNTTVAAMMYKYSVIGNVQINAFTEGRASNFGNARHPGAVGHFDLRSDNGVTQVVYSGDWVIQFESGSLMVVTNEVFRKNYKDFQ